MNKSGPILIIEDDIDDQELFLDAFGQLNYPNEIVFKSDGVTALEYLEKTDAQPFLILSDINLPKLNGFQLKEKVHNNEQLKLKCIPYLFFTTTSDQRKVIDAYSQSIQGFFIKPTSYTELVRILRNIVEYWKDCQSPSVS